MYVLLEATTVFFCLNSYTNIVTYLQFELMYWNKSFE